jgi:hypothetical protein
LDFINGRGAIVRRWKIQLGAFLVAVSMGLFGSVLAVQAPAHATGYYKYCKRSVANSLSVFWDSTTSATKWPHSVGYGTVMYAGQSANGRYHVSLWDTSGATNGWVSTAWVVAC